MRGLKEFSEQVTEVNKQLKDLERDVSNKEAKKLNLDTDILRLTVEFKALEVKVKDLSKTLAGEIARALGPAQDKIAGLEDSLKVEIKKTQEERGKLAGEKEAYKEKSLECDRAIKKNQEAARILEAENSEAGAIRQKLLSAVNTIQEILK